MASNCNNIKAFLPAEEAMLHAKNRHIVWEEICHLQQEILTGLQTDDMCIYVTENSPMQLHASSENYYKAALNEIDHTTVYIHHLEAVQSFFHNLGYSIKLHGTEATQTIAWKICWC